MSPADDHRWRLAVSDSLRGFGERNGRPRAPALRTRIRRVWRAGEDFKVRRANDTGMVSMAGKSFYVSHLLKGQPVGFREVDSDEWEIHYGPLLIGHLLFRQGKARIEPIQ
jgi:hypothetical protein